MENTDRGAAQATKKQVETEAQRIIDCKVVLGKTKAQISTLLGSSPVRPKELGGGEGDNFRMWRWGAGPGLYVTFDDGGVAAKAEIEHTECDSDVFDC